MSDVWDRIVDRSDGEYVRDVFEVAYYRLLQEQVLYYADRRARSSYALVDKFEDEFRSALDLAGCELRIHRPWYAAAIPRHAKSSNASVEETLFALVLRKLYDEGMHRGEMNEQGEIGVELTTLAERFRLETQRAFPEKGRLDAVLRACKRWGLARLQDDDEEFPLSPGEVDQPYTVVIRAAIVDILGVGALDRLAQWRPGQDATTPPPVPSPGEDGRENETEAA